MKEVVNIPQLVDTIYINALYNNVIRLLIKKPMENLAQGLKEEADNIISEWQEAMKKQVDECADDLRKSIDIGNDKS